MRLRRRNRRIPPRRDLIAAPGAGERAAGDPDDLAADADRERPERDAAFAGQHRGGGALCLPAGGYAPAGPPRARAATERAGTVGALRGHGNAAHPGALRDGEARDRGGCQSPAGAFAGDVRGHREGRAGDFRGGRARVQHWEPETVERRALRRAGAAEDAKDHAGLQHRPARARRVAGGGADHRPDLPVPRADEAEINVHRRSARNDR